MDTKFSDNFWDEKLTGYITLFQNVRNSQNSIKEFENFLREIFNHEDQNQKQMQKLSAIKFNSDSTIHPLYSSILKGLNEQNSLAHLKYMNKIYELIKQVQIYGDEFRKKKHKLKQNDLKTIEKIEEFRQIRTQVNKSRDQYIQISTELEKQKKILEHTHSTSNLASSQILIQKLEKKFLIIEEDYQGLIERYNTIRSEYETKFIESCDQFQELEQWHLTQMKSFLDEYLTLVHNLNSNRVKNQQECQLKLSKFTTDQLLDQFLLNKSVGQYKPMALEFIKLVNYNPEISQLDKSEVKLFNFLNIDLLSKIRLSKREKTQVTNLDLTNSGLFEERKSLKGSLESLEYLGSKLEKSQEGDMTNFYELSDDEENKKEIKSDENNEGGSTSSYDDESDDSDYPKRIVLKIKPLDTLERTTTTTPDLLNQISKNLQLKSSTTKRKKVFTKSYKIDENNNNEIIEDKGEEQKQPPPLPPLPVDLQLIMTQRVSELNRNLERSFNQSPLSTSLNRSFVEEDFEEMQF